MANINAQMVKELRDQTGAGMMDCKNALVKAEGDIEVAIDNLRKSGIAKAEKKSSRTVKEGRIVAEVDGNKGVLLEALCETDFVATNDKFIDYSSSIASGMLENYSEDGNVSEKVQEQEKDTLTAKIAIIGENMQLRRALRWETNGQIAYYLHGKRIGVMIDVEGEANEELLHDICMHIAAFKPTYIVPEEISVASIEKEKEIARAQMAGKPDNIIEKIIVGKINKWYSDVCLTKQPWIRDDKQSLSKIAPKITVKRFVRWEIGEEL